MTANRLILGQWNVVCDVCGLKFKNTDLRQDWRGLWVCHKDYEPKHPQLYIKVPKDDPSVPWARPDNDTNVTAPACYLWNIEAFTGMATTGCAQVGNILPFNSIQLYALMNPPSPA